MTAKRVFFAMLGLIVLVSAGGIAVLVLGNSALQKHSAQLVDLKLQDRLYEEQQTALKKANADITKYAELERIAKTIVPQDKDQAAAVREMIDIASKAGLSISQISFNTSNLGSQTKSSGSSSGSGASASTNASSNTTSPLSQAKPVDGLPGVYALEISIVPSSASYYQFLSFLTGLESNRRTAQVSSIEITPTVVGKRIASYNYKLTVNIFIKPLGGNSK